MSGKSNPVTNKKPTDSVRAKPRVIVVSGLSGGGKSTALNALEDLGYYCVDNLPAALLEGFARQIIENPEQYAMVALGVDARTRGPEDLEQVPAWLDHAAARGLDVNLLFLTASPRTLIRRFSETRRRHPLTSPEHALPAAIEKEVFLLKELKQRADWVLDSSDTNIHQLRRQVWKCAGGGSEGMSVVLESFAFKRGVPQDVDFVFDARNLPNPHWEPELREMTGKDSAVRDWLEQYSTVLSMSEDIRVFLGRWLPGFDEVQRSYVTIGVGCTGGRHRSVYLVEKLSAALRRDWPHVLVHHRELL
jgi:UPF0042 nucleotide-binding protein